MRPLNAYIHNQNYTCPYCQQRIVVEHNAVWDIEHIIPKSSHPQFLFEPQNLCVSCKDCNGEKLNKNVLVRPNAVRFPRDSTGYIFVHPHFDKYNDHIRIVGDYSFFFADTEKGRKTIEICGLIRFTVALSNYAPLPTEVFTKSHTYHQKIMETDSSKEQLLYLCLLENEINKIKDQLLGEFSK